MLFRLISFAALLITVWAHELSSSAEPTKTSRVADRPNEFAFPSRQLTVGSSPRPSNLLDQTSRTRRMTTDTGKISTPSDTNLQQKLPKPVNDHSMADSSGKPPGPQKLQKMITGKVADSNAPPVTNTITPKLTKKIPTSNTTTPKIELTQTSKRKPAIVTELPQQASGEFSHRFKKPSIDSLYNKKHQISHDLESSTSRRGTGVVPLSNFKKPPIDDSNTKRRPDQIDGSRILRRRADIAVTPLRPSNLPQTQIRPRMANGELPFRVRRAVTNAASSTLGASLQFHFT